MRKAYADWVEKDLGPWDLITTLTYDPKRRYGRPTNEPVIKDTHHFYREVQRRLHRRLVAVTAVERHENDWPHCHALIRLQGGADELLTQLVSSIWRSLHGSIPESTRVELIQDQTAAVRYVTKHFNQDLDVADIDVFPESAGLSALRLRTQT